MAYIKYLLVLITMISPAYADGIDPPDCAEADFAAEFGPVDATPSCMITWIENNEKISVQWVFPEAHLETASITQSYPTQILASQRPPTLIDIDGDGQMELKTFTLIGMVNGDLAIFKRPTAGAAFMHYGTMHGAGFIRDESGYIVSSERGGGGTTYFTFHERNDGLKPEFTLKVEASISPEQQCFVRHDGQPDVSVTDNPRLPARAKANPDMIPHYCATYSNTDAPRRGPWLQGNDAMANIVPTSTVFHCQLEGNSHAVTVTQDDSLFTYKYGPINGAPELTLNSVDHPFTVVIDDPSGPYYVAEVKFYNGAYAYQILSAFSFNEGNNETVDRFLAVFNNDTIIFNKGCLDGTIYDEIALLEPT